jgi:hypothetical protein
MKSRETVAITKVVSNMLNNGVGDDLVVACLTDSMDTCFKHLRLLHLNSKDLKEYELQDLQDSVDFIRAAIVVLRHYTTDTYEEEAKMVNSLTITPEDYF